MHALTRSLLHLLLVLTLVLTGEALVTERGRAAAAGQMVICTGTGTVMVSVDAEGKPTGPAHICPDGALALFDDGPGMAVLPPALPLLVALPKVESRVHIAGAGTVPSVARGPPAV
ncbi:hypothetical protein E0K89_003070 [Aquicoccus sp. SCR17]|nr:hypothetical protein [Carideicomes alvinocaridis]